MGCAGVAMAVTVQTDMATPSLHRHGSHQLKQRYLAPALRGEMVAAIAVTEADAGSDVAGIRTRAVRDGDEWVINGSKLYITNGIQADWLCLLARTSDEGGYRGHVADPVPDRYPRVLGQPEAEQARQRLLGHGGTALRRRQGPGVQHDRPGRPGLPAADEPVPERADDRGLHRRRRDGQPRSAAPRTTFASGRRSASPLLSRQYVQFRLAELSAEVDLLRHYNYACAAAYLRGEDTTRFATIAKLKAGRLARAVADTCLQFHGGFGYMAETWVSRYFRDSRLLSVGGGADEVMLQILARMDGLRRLSGRRPEVRAVCAAARARPAGRHGRSHRCLRRSCRTAVDPGDEAFVRTSEQMLGLLAEIDRLAQQAALGGGDKAIERHRQPRQAADQGAHRAAARSGHAFSRAEPAGGLPDQLRGRRRHGARDRGGRGNRVRDRGQRPDRPGRGDDRGQHPQADAGPGGRQG